MTSGGVLWPRHRRRRAARVTGPKMMSESALAHYAVTRYDAQEASHAV
jgi:hypothetical protein